MNSSNYQANSLVELADEIRSGEISLKDLYYSQLISDIEHLDDAEFTDIEADPDYHNQESLDSFHPLVNFEFTKNVMSQVRQVAKAKQAQQQPNQKSNKTNVADKGFYGFSIPNALTVPNYSNIATGSNVAQNEIGKTTTNSGYQSFYSESITSQNQPNNRKHSETNSTSQSSDVATAPTSISGFFTKSNLLVAFIAFMLTMITVSLVNIYKSNESGFSTLASNNPPSAVQQQVAMQQILEQKPIILVNKKAEPQDYTLNFGTALISHGIKLVSFSKTTAIHSGLMLASKEATNLSILFSNFEIQKRLAK